MSQPPWHLWGGSDITTAQSVSGRPPVGSGQLARAHAKLPLTWHWMLSARLLTFSGGSDVAAPGDVIDCTCLFDFTVGVGRTLIQLATPFERLNLRWAFPNVAPINGLIWSTQAVSPIGPPNRSWPDAITNETIPNVTSQIVAEDIQVSTRVQLQAVVGGVNVVRTVTVELSCLLSPKTHIRPDWFRADPRLDKIRFGGGETEGT